MTHVENRDVLPGIVDLVDHPIVPHSNSEAFPAGQFATSRRVRVFAKVADRGNDLLEHGSRESAELLLRATENEDAIKHFRPRRISSTAWSKGIASSTAVFAASYCRIASSSSRSS